MNTSVHFVKYFITALFPNIFFKLLNEVAAFSCYFKAKKQKKSPKFKQRLESIKPSEVSEDDGES